MKNISKIILGIVVLFALFFAFTLIAENKSLDAFARGYSDFKNQQYDTSIYSYVPIVDGHSETGEENYFTYLARAVDTKQSNNFRKVNAEQALAAYNSMNREAIDIFSERIGKLDSAASQLVEAANTIDKHEHRATAVEVAKQARQIQQNYRDLLLKYVERFNLQTKLLGELVNNGGDIFALGNTLKDGGTKIPKIGEDIESLMEETEKVSQKMDDLYSSLKGRTGIKDYPNKFTENK